MTWRYIAQDLPSGKIIDPDLPLTGVNLTDAVSAPRGLSGSLGDGTGKWRLEVTGEFKGSRIAADSYAGRAHLRVQGPLVD